MPTSAIFDIFTHYVQTATFACRWRSRNTYSGVVCELKEWPDIGAAHVWCWIFRFNIQHFTKIRSGNTANLVRIRRQVCYFSFIMDIYKCKKKPNSFFASVVCFLIQKENSISCDHWSLFFSLMKCIFCDEHFNGKVQFRDDYLRHLLQQHKFVIGDFKTVPDFRRYETVRLARRNQSYSWFNLSWIQTILLNSFSLF